MTLRMGDGPPGNIPPGLDALGGYVNQSGIGTTWPAIQAMPARFHLSITTDGSPADCADVEHGAMSSWAGYTVGYCEISQAQALINRYGRPRKLWTAHRESGPGGVDTPHLCTPACGFGFTDRADGTQWTNHGGAWDESLLADNFFDYQQPDLERLTNMQIGWDQNGHLIIVGVAADNGNLLQFVENPPGTWGCIDVTDATHAANPGDPRLYRIKD